MKKKLPKALILDYVNGNDIYYDIDELENNYEFMLDVIDYTKDKNMYNLCSDNVKNNYEFVKKIISIFKEDKKFISTVADRYLNMHNKEDITYNELLVIMSNLCSNEYDSILRCYSIQANIFYQMQMMQIDMVLNDEKKKQWIDNIGSGFVIVKEIFKGSKIITKFFAERMVSKIFYGQNNYSFEENLHIQFKYADDLKNIGVNSYIINKIREYDNTLADYTINNQEIIDDIKKNLNKILNNWDNYIKLLNQKRFEIMSDEIRNYIEKCDINGINLSCVEVEQYVICKLRLQGIYNQYIGSLTKKYLDILAQYDLYVDDIVVEELKESDLSIKKLNVTELKCINYAMNYAKKLFEKDVIEKIFDDYDEINKKTTSKILTFQKRDN